MTVINEADAIYIGPQALSALYAGPNKIWPAAPPVLGYLETVMADSPVAYWRMGLPVGPAADVVGGTSASRMDFNPGTGTISLDESLLPNGEGASNAFTSPAGTLTPNVPAGVFPNGPAMSWEFWVRLTELPPGPVGGVGGLAQVVNPTLLFVGVLATGRFHVGTSWAGGIPWVESTSLLAVGVSYHIVVTRDGDTPRIYINGHDASGPVTPRTFTQQTSRFRLGGAPNSPFNGSIQEVAIYDYPLTAQQVANHYAAAQP